MRTSRVLVALVLAGDRGTAGRDEQFMVPVLRTGRRPTGRVPLPPMPPLRMNREDAEAIAAYLRSLR